MTEEEQIEILKQWLSDYKSLIFKVIRSFAPDYDTREELFQLISIQLWNSIPKFKGDSSTKTWLYRISLNTALSWNRKEFKHQKDRESFNAREHLLIEKNEDSDPRLDWLYMEISNLNEIDRSITLLMLDGFTYQEIAELMGVSETNIGVKIHRLKKYLIEQSKTKIDHGI